MTYTPTKMMIKLSPEESRALQRSASLEHRSPQNQAAMLIRRGLGLDGQTVILSSLSTAALSQIAKDEGLSTVDEALELVLVRHTMITE